MKTKKHWLAGTVVLSSIGLIAPVAFAQHGSGGQHGAGAAQHKQAAGPHAMQAPHYDTSTEATLKGTVEDVTTTGRTMGRGGMSMQERQFALKTDTGRINVRLGPPDFVTEKKVQIANGDVVEVIGSRVTVGESQVLLAREVRKGGASWTLRDTSGEPLWATAQHGKHK